MSYQSPLVAKPDHGRVCVVFTGEGRHHIAVFRKELGDFGAGGDFGIITIGKRTTKIEHLPNVLVWEEVRIPTPEEWSTAWNLANPNNQMKKP